MPTIRSALSFNLSRQERASDFFLSSSTRARPSCPRGSWCQQSAQYIQTVLMEATLQSTLQYPVYRRSWLRVGQFEFLLIVEFDLLLLLIHQVIRNIWLRPDYLTFPIAK
nr:hypothetical protein Iba_chr12dCG16550 [Ipomoea batatas]